MSEQGKRRQLPGEDSRREVRAERILNTALELVQRWGYKKTTIDDIARQAGVPKGTIFLHWKTREDLFEALLLREWLSTITDLKLRLSNDPARVTLSALSRQIVLITASNPLFRAMLLGNTETLGDLIYSSTGQRAVQFRLEMAQTYLELLRNNGLLRTDLSGETLMKVLTAIFMGFFVVDQFLPPGSHFSPEELAETLALTLHRTFEPEEPPPPAAVEEVTRAFNRLLDRLIDALKYPSKEEE